MKNVKDNDKQNSKYGHALETGKHKYIQQWEVSWTHKIFKKCGITVIGSPLVCYFSQDSRMIVYLVLFL
jgi:hypothetical protein